MSGIHPKEVNSFGGEVGSGFFPLALKTKPSPADAQRHCSNSPQSTFDSVIGVQAKSEK